MTAHDELMRRLVAEQHQVVREWDPARATAPPAWVREEMRALGARLLADLGAKDG